MKRLQQDLAYKYMVLLTKNAQSVINTLRKAGFEAYAVGGSVRDRIMKRKTHGWDFTTNATPEHILSLFPDSFYDNQFGTVGIKRKNSKNITSDVFEITTYRSESGYIDHRHPESVRWGTSIEEDLSRRDFTINAIATDGKKIIDPYNGQDDIKQKCIRAVGNPNERFAEDALRMMRAVRISAELGFLIEEQTATAIKNHASTILRISAERIQSELMKILSSDNPAEGILFLRSTTLLSYIIPELDSSFRTPQKSPKRHHVYDVGTHSVMAMKYCQSGDPIVRLATLLHDIGKTPTYQKGKDGVITFYNHEVVSTRLVRIIADRLRLSKKDKDKLVTMVRWHQFSVDEHQTDSALRRFIRRVGKENLDDMLALRIGDRLGGGARETSWRLGLYKKRLLAVQQQPFTVSDLAVSGHDVMEVFGCPPGPLVGKILGILFAEVEKGLLPNKRTELLARLNELYKNEK